MVDFLGVIQCRLSSSRLYAKAMLDLAGKPILERVIESCSSSLLMSKLVVVTSNDFSDNIIEMFCKNLGVDCFRGDLGNVHSRFCSVASNYKANNVVRITADNPISDGLFIDRLIRLYKSTNCLYATLIDLPYGCATEVFAAKLLDIKDSECSEMIKEHVTYEMKNNLKSKKFEIFKNNKEYEKIKATIDTKEDYLRMANFFWNCKINKKAPDISNFIEYWYTQKDERIISC